MNLFDKTELCGRTLNVGRPRGYVAPGEQPAPPLIPGLTGMPQQTSASPAPASTCLRLEVKHTPYLLISPISTTHGIGTLNPFCPTCTQGLITDSMLSGEEYEDVLDDIKQECERSGPVADIKIPREGELKVSLVKWRACPISNSCCTVTMSSLSSTGCLFRPFLRSCRSSESSRVSASPTIRWEHCDS